MEVMTKPNLTGEYVTASFGGSAGLPVMEDGTEYQAEQTTAGGKMRVVGTAVEYGVVGQFWSGAIRIAAGAFDGEWQDKKKKSATRDVMGLAFHDSGRPLARTANNTMDLEFAEDKVTYEMRLNPDSMTAQDVWAMLQRGDVTASSIGFSIEAMEWVKGTDNGLDAESDAEIDIVEVTAGIIHEVSIVAQGAFGGASSRPVSASRTAVLEQGVEDDTEQAEWESPSLDLAEGGAGDDGGSGKKIVGGCSEPDDGGEHADREELNQQFQQELEAWLRSEEDAMRKRGIIN